MSPRLEGAPLCPAARTHSEAGVSAAQGRGGHWGRRRGQGKGNSGQGEAPSSLRSSRAAVSLGEFWARVTIRKIFLLLSNENFAFCDY